MVTISVFISVIYDCHTRVIMLPVVTMSVFVSDICVVTISVFSLAVYDYHIRV